MQIMRFPLLSGRVRKCHWLISGAYFAAQLQVVCLFEECKVRGWAFAAVPAPLISSMLARAVSEPNSLPAVRVLKVVLYAIQQSIHRRTQHVHDEREEADEVVDAGVDKHDVGR